jgi:hypothetical protein
MGWKCNWIGGNEKSILFGVGREATNKGGNFRDKGEIITTPVIPFQHTLQTLYQTVGLYDDW